MGSCPVRSNPARMKHPPRRFDGAIRIIEQARATRAADIKGTNRIKYTVADRPILCDEKVRQLGDAVAIVAAETKEQALAAAEAVVVRYELLPVLGSPAAALADGAPRVHADTPNLCYRQPITKGDAAAAFATSAAEV